MKKILYSILAVVMGAGVVAAPMVTSAPTYAASCTCISSGQQGVVTAILGESGVDERGQPVNCSCDDGKGSGVINILNLVVRIMTVGIGILATIGVVVSGIQYMTAGGNEERTRKSKRRIFEIVIGVLAYVLVFAVLDWLIPGFNPYGL